MAYTTQYIGSRYVPMFADPAEWDSTRTYEPLTIVLNGGNSYTSRQFVPVGVNLTNTDYWLETGNFNAQVEAYRQEVITALDKMPTITLADYLNGASPNGKIVYIEKQYNNQEITFNGYSNFAIVGSNAIDFVGSSSIKLINCNSITIYNVAFANNITNSLVCNVTDSYNVTFIDCSMNNIVGNGIKMTNSTNMPITRNISFYNCKFTDVNINENQSGGAIYCDGYGNLDPSSTSVSIKNQIQYVYVIGCTFINAGLCAVFFGGANHCIIANNICRTTNTALTASMGLTSINRQSSYITVVNNTIEYTKYEGIICAHANHVTIANNVIKNCRYSIEIERDSEYIYCSNNNCNMESNLFTIPTYAFGVQNSSNLYINGNVNHNQSRALIYTGTVDTVYIDGNTFNNGITYTSENALSNIFYTNNKFSGDNKICIGVVSGELICKGNILIGQYFYYIYRNTTNNVNIVITDNYISGQYVIDVTGIVRRDSNLHFYIGNNTAPYIISVFNKIGISLQLNTYIVGDIKFKPNDCYNYWYDNHPIMIDCNKAEYTGDKLQYTEFKIGTVIFFNDCIAVVTRSGNAATGATLQYASLPE